MEKYYKLKPNIFERIWYRIKRVFTKQYYIKTNNIYHKPQFTVSVYLDWKLFYITYKEGEDLKDPLFTNTIRMYWGSKEGQDPEAPTWKWEWQVALLRIWDRQLTKKELKELNKENNGNK